MKSKFNILFEQVMDDIKFPKKHGKLNLLDSKSISPEMLEELVEDEDWHVRKEVAMNPNTPVEILKKLTEDKVEWVRHGVVTNPNTPVEILKKLAEDRVSWVREEVAKNPNTPVEILKKLAGDYDYVVRRTAKRQMRHLKQNNKHG